MDPEQRGFWRAPYNDGLTPAVGETMTVLNQRIIVIEETQSNIIVTMNQYNNNVKTLSNKVDKLTELIEKLLKGGT